MLRVVPGTQEVLTKSEIKSIDECSKAMARLTSFCDFRPRVNRIIPRIFLWGQASRGTDDKWRVTKEAG